MGLSIGNLLEIDIKSIDKAYIVWYNRHRLSEKRSIEMEFWQERGLAIANSNTVKKNKLGWQVPSQSGNGTYIVNMDNGEPFCTCQHFETTHRKCQHIYAVEFIVQREVQPDGKVIETRTARITYGQDWPAYNEAQTHEQEKFVALLRDLCDGIEQPEYRFGRPRLPLADVVFGLVFKSYIAMSGRRLTSQLKEAQESGLIGKAVHYNSSFRYLENPELTPLLKTLIEQSASPLKAVETDFAVDSSGFSTKTYSPWFDHKYGNRERQKWVKVHLMCGVKTHIATSVEATPYESGDSTQLIPLLKKTAETFPISEVSADKAYSSRKNLHAVQAVGGTAYIPFKGNARGMGSPTTGYDGLWHRMWHYYNFNREQFLAHYHKRSNVESAFSMIKAKFGGAVRAKTPVAQVNEVLCKVLCHNICVLIQSIYELGLEPTFCLDKPMAVCDER
jgi:transposase